MKQKKKKKKSQTVSTMVFNLYIEDEMEELRVEVQEQGEMVTALRIVDDMAFRAEKKDLQNTLIAINRLLKTK